MKKILTLMVIFLAVSLNLLGQTRNSQPVDPKRESPQATLNTFMAAFKKPRVGVSPDPIEEAIRCLDLQAMPADYREVKGFEISSQLLEIIDTVENFHIQDAPNAVTGEPFLIYRSQAGEIVIAKQPSGEWLFTQETVRSVPLLLVSVEEERKNFGSATLTHSDSVGSQIRDKMPNFLRQQSLGLERWQWLGLLVLLILSGIFGLIVKTVISWTLGKILRKRYTSLTEENVKILYAPIGLLAFTAIFRLGLRSLALTQSALGFLRTTMFLLTAFAIVWLIYKIVDAVALRLQQKALETESQSDDLLVPFLSVIVRITIVFIGLIVVAENLNFNVTGLIAGLGIGGIAIALASQETLSNFFGSLVLMVERPFMASDRVTIGGVQGTVKEVGIRSTKIQTFDDSLVTVPNSNVVKSNIVNDGLHQFRSWIVKLAVPYQNGTTKLEDFCKGVEKIIKQSDSLNNEIYKLHIFDIVPPTVVVRVEINFKNDEFGFELAARQAFIMEILRLTEKMEIELKVSK